MFLTSNSLDLCVLTLCIKIRQNNLYLASLQEKSADSNKIIAVITSTLQLIFPEISGKFPEILNFRKIYNPTHHKLHCVWSCH